MESSIVLLKDSGDIVPPRSAQGNIVSNRDIGAISLASRVLKVPVRGGASSIPFGSLLQVSNVRFRVEHIPALGVDLVDTESRVDVRVRSDRGSNPSSGNGALSGFGTGSIVEGKLVVVGVTKELLSNDVGRVTLNDLVVESRPVLETVGLRRSNVTDDPHTLTSILSLLKLSNQPLDLTVGVVFLGVTIEVKVQGVAKVGVQRDETETWSRVDSVSTIVLDRVSCISGKPARPVVGQTVVEPLDVTTRGRCGEQAITNTREQEESSAYLLPANPHSLKVWHK